jgi:hypothetical protein
VHLRLIYIKNEHTGRTANHCASFLVCDGLHCDAGGPLRSSLNDSGTLPLPLLSMRVRAVGDIVQNRYEWAHIPASYAILSSLRARMADPDENGAGLACCGHRTCGCTSLYECAPRAFVFF